MRKGTTQKCQKEGKSSDWFKLEKGRQLSSELFLTAQNQNDNPHTGPDTPEAKRIQFESEKLCNFFCLCGCELK